MLDPSAALKEKLGEIDPKLDGLKTRLIEILSQSKQKFPAVTELETFVKKVNQSLRLGKGMLNYERYKKVVANSSSAYIKQYFDVTEKEFNSAMQTMQEKTAPEKVREVLGMLNNKEFEWALS